MHDPMTVAHEIKYPWRKYGKRAKSKFDSEYRAPFITVWHVDPEKDGTDDSCGWFMRERHVSKENLNRVVNDFEFEWDADYGGWFNKDGTPRSSVIAITLAMFSRAAYAELQDWKKVNKFMNRNMYEFINFAENNIDSASDSITGKYGIPEREERIRSMAVMFYTYVCRKLRPWHRHPRWHIHHWKIQFHPWCNFRRRYLDKCCKCGKRGFKTSAMGNWSGTELWHQECGGLDKKEQNEPTT